MGYLLPEKKKKEQTQALDQMREQINKDDLEVWKHKRNAAKVAVEETYLVTEDSGGNGGPRSERRSWRRRRRRAWFSTIYLQFFWNIRRRSGKLW